MAEAIDAVDILDLSDCDLITNSWLTGAERTYSPNTIVSYLLSFGHFTDYLLTKTCVNYFQISKTELEDLRYFKEQLPRWRKSYAKDRQRRHWSNMAEFVANPLEAADVERYERSDACKEAVALLSNLMEARSLQVTRKIAKGKPSKEDPKVSV